MVGARDTQHTAAATTAAAAAGSDANASGGEGGADLEIVVVEDFYSSTSNNDNVNTSTLTDEDDGDTSITIPASASNGTSTSGGVEGSESKEETFPEGEERFCRICVEAVLADSLHADDATQLGCACVSGRDVSHLSYTRMWRSTDCDCVVRREIARSSLITSMLKLVILFTTYQ
jgi:hypothetical protein